MLINDRDAIRQLLDEVVDRYQRENSGQCLDVDIELERLAEFYPSEVSARAAELRQELARLAAARLIPIRMG